MNVNVQSGFMQSSGIPRCRTLILVNFVAEIRYANSLKVTFEYIDRNGFYLIRRVRVHIHVNVNLNWPTEPTRRILIRMAQRNLDASDGALARALCMTCLLLQIILDDFRLLTQLAHHFFQCLIESHFDAKFN